MLKLSRMGRGSLAVMVAGVIAAGALVGCGDNKAKQSARTDGGDGGGICSGSFVSPISGATLTIADDINKSCSGSLHTNVSLATSADDGTNVDLYVGTTKVDSQKVSGAEVHFMNVQLPQGSDMLQAVFSASCTISETVTVNCNLPMCTITAPTLSATHVALNGVPVANGGDRVSASGTSYQVEFDVSTDVEDGQPVQLKVTPMGSTVSTIVEGTAVKGKVVFAGVTLVPDGNYTIEADCTNKAGVVGASAKGMYPVDSTPPTLTISSPANGTYFGPNDLKNNSFQVCAQTPDKDATALPAALGAAVNNLSVAVGTGSPDPTNGYAAVTATATDTCLNVACTSSTPVDLTVTLKDAAGNATVKTISQISCATTLPGVQIVSPTSDSMPFGDPTKHLLAASSTNTLRDQDPVTPGAQWTVVACSNTSGKATLMAGAMGGSLLAVAGPVNTAAATPADGCATGFPNAARFVGATIPDSQEQGDGALGAATELRVDVTASTSAVGMSSLVDLWVDSVVPGIQQYSPNPLCGLIHQSVTNWQTPVQLISTSPMVTLSVASPGGSMDYPVTNWANSFANFGTVTFFVGANQVTATATDAAGNSGTLMSPCTVTVGTPPVVTFTTPTAGNTLCASTSTTGTCVADGDGTTAGWQGNVAVSVSVLGSPATAGTVTFSAGAATLGTANIDGTGHAQLTGVTIPDGRAVSITAVTSDIAGNGTGIAAETLAVDTIVPDAVAALNAAVLSRRQTSFHLSWAAPADGGQQLFSYVVKVSRTAITSANFDAATTIPFTGTAAAPGMSDGIDIVNRLIENNYFFAVASIDAAGNRSGIAAAGPVAAHFMRNILLPPAGGPTNERFSSSVDGVADLNGDGKSDVLVGAFAGQRAYVFNGSAAFDMVTAPSVVITGPAAAGFARQFVDIGDIDADGKDDFAISAPLIGNGRIYIFKGRATWNPTYVADTDADYIIELDSTYAGTFFGGTLTRLGDFNGDGVDDFAVGCNSYAGGRGRVVIVLGKAGFSAASANLMTMDGDPAYPTGTFGGTVLGIGRFFTNNGGNSLVVSATAAGANNRGRVYAFEGITGTTAAINATMANTFVEGPDNSFYGTSLGLLGAIGGVPGIGIGAGRALASANGIADLYFGTVTNPFGATPIRFTDSLATTANDVFGRLVLGGVFAGTSTSVSLIGDSKPDVVMAPFTESAGGAPRLYIIDGARLSTLGSPNDIVTTADVILPLPSDWKSLPLQRNGLIKDLDGDGYGDFAIGENFATGAGRLAVFW